MAPLWHQGKILHHFQNPNYHSHLQYYNPLKLGSILYCQFTHGVTCSGYILGLVSGHTMMTLASAASL